MAGLLGASAWAQSSAAVSRIEFTSNAGADRTYPQGRVIALRATFTEPVWAVNQPGIRLSLDGSATSTPALATFRSGSGSRNLRFDYQVRAGDSAPDGISVPSDAFVLGAGDRIIDGRGFNATLTHAALRRQDAHRVDGVAPQVTAINVASPAGTYSAGQHIDFDLTFNEGVVAGAAELVVTLAEPNASTRTRRAKLIDSGSSDTLRFRYTVQVGDQDRDGISVEAGALIGGTVADTVGNRAMRNLPARTWPTHTVGVAAVGVARVAVTSRPRRGDAYRTGEAIQVGITFDAPVYVTGDVTLGLSIGARTRAAAFTAGSGTRTLVFRYIVRGEDQDDDGVSIAPGVTSLTGGTIEDEDGMPANRAFAGVPNLAGHKVGADDGDGDGAAMVERVAVTSRPSRGDTYRTGETIQVSVFFNATVYVRGDVTLDLSIGARTRAAAFADGSGSRTLLFRYTVRGDDQDDDGISIAPGADSLTGGTIRDADGNDALRDFTALPADSGHRVAGTPTTVATRVRIASETADGYQPGDAIRVIVAFNNVVHVRGSPTLALVIGGETRRAAYASGSGTTELTFQYTVQSGDSDTDGISVPRGGESLTGGVIEDQDGTAVTRDFNALPDDANHRVVAAPSAMVTAALPRLVVGGTPTEVRLASLLSQTGLGYRGGFEAPEVTPANVVRAALSGQSTGTVLTVFPYAEGTANVALTARSADITVVFSVSVGTDVGEGEVLEDVLASVGRGLLASATDVIGGRLKRDPTAPLAPEVSASHAPSGGRWTDAANGAWAGAGGGESLRWLSAAQRLHPDPNHPQRGMAAQQLLSSLAFDMPLVEQEQGGSSVALWGAGDVRRFDGEVEEGTFDGDMELAYLGLDARIGNWVVGAAAAHSRAEATYDAITATGTIEGGLETELTAFHPYAQWNFGERTEAWAILGYGEGEVMHTRDGLGYVDEPSDLTMAMGLAGMRGILARGPHFGLVWHGDAGMIQLETEEEAAAISDLSLQMSRARLGVEASYRMAFGDGRYSLTPFFDVTARYDGGDGEDGAGVEVAGGLRYKGPIVSFEAKARSLVWHGADGYSESGASAAIIVQPGSDGRGLRLSLAPRWGGSADSMDVFWRHSGFAGRRGWRGDQERDWGLGGRLSYGFGVNRGLGTLTPFADFDFAGSARRTRIGVGYGLSSPWGIPLRIDLSGERMEDERGADHRFLLTGEALF